MKKYAVFAPILVAIVVLFSGCASTPRDSVKVAMYEPRILKNDESQLEAFFHVEQSIGVIDTGDGERVTDLQQLTFNADNYSQISRAAASPTQDAVVYAMYTNGVSTLFRQSLGSQARSPLIAEPGLNLTPAFTPDGRFLIFSSDRSGETQSLWRKRADGAGGITQMTSSSSFDWHPSVAADGETIIFQSHRKNNIAASIWSINMNGGLLTQLGPGYSPKVSPDGRRVVFVKPDGNGVEQIWSMQLDASGLTQLSTGGANDYDPSWHPNGRYIVFASDEAVPVADAAKPGKMTSDSNIWIMRADGSERVQLTENRSHDDAPVFERRGRKILFRTNRGGLWNLFAFTPALK